MAKRLGLTYENLLLAILFFTFGTVFIDRTIITTLFPKISADLGLNNSQLGLLAGALALTWSFSGFVVGRVSDRLGKRKPLLLLAVVIFSLACGLAGAAQSFAVLFLLRAVMGVAEGPVQPMMQTLMVAASSERRRGVNMGLLQGSAPGLMGFVLAPPLLVWVAERLGWRSAFYVSCLPGLILALLIWWLVKEPGQGQGTGEKIVHTGEKGKGSLGDLFKYYNVRVCVVVAVLACTWFFAIINFMPTFLEKDRHFKSGTMSLMLSALGAAWVFWGFFAPALSDRFGRKPVMFTFLLIGVLAPLALLHVSNPYLLAALLFLTFTGPGCFSLFGATIPAETVPRYLVATALGTVMGIGEILGAFLAPIVEGRAADRYGLSVTMWVAVGAGVLAALFSLLVRETAPVKVGKRLEATEYVAAH